MTWSGIMHIKEDRRCAGRPDREEVSLEQQQPWRQGWRREHSQEGQRSREGRPGELAGQCEGFISRRPSWEAAPDRELGKGQQPRVRGGPVLMEEAPMRVLAR